MLHELFNDKANEFVRDLVQAFPNVQEFRQLKSALTVLRNVDPKKPQQIFDAAVLSRYRQTILAKDDAAFQKISLDEMENVQERNAWMPFVDRLKAMWQNLGAADREAIWRHFFVLLTVSDRVKGPCSSTIANANQTATVRV